MPEDLLCNSACLKHEIPPISKIPHPVPGQYYFCPGQVDMRKERVFVELMLHFSQLKKDKIAYML